MAINQNTQITIITNDNYKFPINYFSPELGLSNFLKPILLSYLDDDVEE